MLSVVFRRKESITMMTETIPSEYLCPISMEIMKDPVVLCEDVSISKEKKNKHPRSIHVGAYLRSSTVGEMVKRPRYIAHNKSKIRITRIYNKLCFEIIDQ